MADETREQRVRRIVRAVVADLKLGPLATVKVDAASGEALITVYGDRMTDVRLPLLPSDENMRKELRRRLRDALGH